jgi:nucleolar protein 53
MMASILHVKSLRKTVESQLSSRERIVAERKAARESRLKDGLAGERLGKHKVASGEIDVQLGDELAETLRELKVRRSLAILGVAWVLTHPVARG